MGNTNFPSICRQLPPVSPALLPLKSCLDHVGLGRFLKSKCTFYQLLNLKGLGVCLYGIRDYFHKPPTTVENDIYLVCWIEFPIQHNLLKRGIKVKSYATTVIRYTLYGIASRSFIPTQMSL